jgi:uracil-DNA glycosylase
MTYQRCIKIQVPDHKDFNGILLVGEAPGAYEETQGKPFVGPAGKLLDNLLSEAGIDRARCAVTNVFHARPEGNQIQKFFTIEQEDAAFLKYPLGYAYVRKMYAPEIKRLSGEIDALAHHLVVIVALGNIALWALTGKMGITKYRGLLSAFTYGKDACLLVPTFHPSYLLHKNSIAETQVVIGDLKLARSVVEKK